MGYDLDRFVGAVNEGLICCICREVLEDPLQAPCEHAYCTTCIQGWLVHDITCPEDRLPLMTSQLKPLFRYMKNDLDKLQIRCCNYSQDGCPSVTNLEFLSSHEALCDLSAQECPRRGCDATVFRKDMPSHLLTCPHDEHPCPDGCGLYIRNSRAGQHQCISELRGSLESLRSEMARKIEDQKLQYDLRLSAQRRYMVQRTTALENTVELLKGHVNNLEQEFRILQEVNARQRDQIDARGSAKRELFDMLRLLVQSSPALGSTLKRNACKLL